MDISLDSKEIQKAVIEALTTTIATSVNDWSFQERVNKVVGKSFEEFGFFREIEKAIAEEMKENMTSVAQAVAIEVSRAAAKMAVSTIRDSMVEVLFKLRRPRDYMTDDEEKDLRARIKGELFS